MFCLRLFEWGNLRCEAHTHRWRASCLDKTVCLPHFSFAWQRVSYFIGYLSGKIGVQCVRHEIGQMNMSLSNLMEVFSSAYQPFAAVGCFCFSPVSIRSYIIPNVRLFPDCLLNICWVRTHTLPFQLPTCDLIVIPASLHPGNMGLSSC